VGLPQLLPLNPLTCHARLFRRNACTDPATVMPPSCHARFVIVGQLMKPVYQPLVWNLHQVKQNTNYFNYILTKDKLCFTLDESRSYYSKSMSTH